MIKQNKILTLHELFKFCEANGVFRLVKVEENDSFVKIIICGVYQIRLNKKHKKSHCIRGFYKLRVRRVAS